MNLKFKAMISILVLFMFAGYVNQAHSQTEGFNVKTPIQKIADSSTKFLSQIILASTDEPKKSVPQSLVCSSSCYLVIPDIEIIPSRGDFTGTGLLSCKIPNSDSFTEPLYYRINNLGGFDEDGGGLIIFGTSIQSMKRILGNDLHLSAGNTAAGKIGSSEDDNLKPLVSYARYKDGSIEGIDLSGSILEYSSKDTFDAYQSTVVPIEIIYSPQDAPPVLRGYAALLSKWTNGCK